MHQARAKGGLMHLCDACLSLPQNPDFLRPDQKALENIVEK